MGDLRKKTKGKMASYFLLISLIGTSLIAVTLAEDCADVKDWDTCGRDKSERRCVESHEKFAKSYLLCRKTCDLCNACADGKPEKCDKYIREGRCDPAHEKHWKALDRCKKSCGLC